MIDIKTERLEIKKNVIVTGGIYRKYLVITSHPSTLYFTGKYVPGY